MRKRRVPATTAKLGLDTVAMLREVRGDWATIDETIWQLAKIVRLVATSDTSKRSPVELTRIPLGILTGIPHDRAVYRDRLKDAGAA